MIKLFEKLRERLREREYEDNVAHLDRFGERLQMGDGIAFRIDRGATPKGVFSFANGPDIAEVVSTVGPIGGGQDEINGYQMLRYADGEIRNYTKNDRRAPQDFIAGGDGMSPNMIDTSRYPSGMRR